MEKKKDLKLDKMEKQTRKVKIQKKDSLSSSTKEYNDADVNH